jgi:putative endonuclease
MDARREFGNEGEERAARFLEGKGLEVTGSQVKTRFGEIDLVCREGDEIVFVEVKTRSSSAFGYPEASITPAKFSNMAQSAEAYLLAHGLSERPWRIDVIAIEHMGGSEQINHFPGVDSPSGNW